MTSTRSGGPASRTKISAAGAALARPSFSLTGGGGASTTTAAVGGASTTTGGGGGGAPFPR